MPFLFVILSLISLACGPVSNNSFLNKNFSKASDKSIDHAHTNQADLAERTESPNTEISEDSDVAQQIGQDPEKTNTDQNKQDTETDEAAALPIQITGAALVCLMNSELSDQNIQTIQCSLNKRGKLIEEMQAQSSDFLVQDTQGNSIVINNFRFTDGYYYLEITAQENNNLVIQLTVKSSEQIVYSETMELDLSIAEPQTSPLIVIKSQLQVYGLLYLVMPTMGLMTFVSCNLKQKMKMEVQCLNQMKVRGSISPRTKQKPHVTHWERVSNY